MFEYGSRLIEEKRCRPGPDMLSAFVHGRVENDKGGLEPPTELELQMFFNLLIAAGSETTRNSMAIGILALIDRPERWQELRREPALVPTAVEEMLRWASSTPYNRRTATRDVELGGKSIHAGDKVTLWWASANRDERVFRDPFEFDIRRSPNPHLAFGVGNHFCLGANLARLEMRIMLEELLATCAEIRLAGPVEWTRSNKHTGLRHMPVVLSPA